jgi:hypothetical protein
MGVTSLVTAAEVGDSAQGGRHLGRREGERIVHDRAPIVRREDRLFDARRDTSE